jgi:hypothetical protein
MKRAYSTVLAGVICASLMGLALPARAQDLGTRRARLLSPFVEWSLDNDSYAGNPFDLAARVTFTHTSGRTITTEMFYDGSDTWKWRFTGTAPGTWTFQTHSSDGDLDGRRGKVTVADAPKARGFVVARQGRWAQQLGADGYRAILPNLAMYTSEPKKYHNNPARIRSDVQTFLVEHGFTGFHLPPLGARLFDIDSSSPKINSSMQNPDPETFEALEQLILATHAAGGTVHIWPWGDTQRGWTADKLEGGENGKVDRRLQRYIAARLGPLPGWTIGYGFDLDEWTSNANMQSWQEYLDEKSGWDHLVSGRSEGPNSGTDHSDETHWHKGLDYAGYEHHEPTYEVYRAAIAASGSKPVLSEDRFRVRGLSGPGKEYTLDQTRRGLWIATMAGGVANIWGNLTAEDGSQPADYRSLPYPNAEQIKTWSVFFNDKQRFTLDMEVDNDLTAGPDKKQYALHSDGQDLVVVYAEQTKKVRLNLAALAADDAWAGGAKVLAVDTRKAYREIDLGTVGMVDQDLDLSDQGGKSDWAVVVQPVP